MAYLVKKIDIHVHSTLEKSLPFPGNCNEFTTPDELRKMYDHLGIEFGVQLPVIQGECTWHLITSEECMKLHQLYPETYDWFCNISPHAFRNAPDTDLSYAFNYYKERGAKGIGEVSFNMPFDDPFMENFFHHAEKCQMPIIFHIGNKGYDYGIVDSLGLPGLEGALKKFPDLIFLGHSQKFWAEISADCTEENRTGYPSGPVTPGRVVELMRKYPNLHGDLSAGSGENAIMRDPEFGYAFMEEFKDRLYFGTDISDPRNRFVLSFYLDDAVQSGHISQECYNKICRENALKLLGRA